MSWFKKKEEEPIVKPKPRSYAEIIKPLTGITAELDDYVARCDSKEAALEQEKAAIEAAISHTKDERSMSDGMAKRLREFTGATE
jgi:hypothetical protein